MLFFAHIFAGAAFGIALAWFIKDWRVIPFCIAVSVIPDVIDKPLGYILLPQALDSGRTFFHALIAVALIAAIAFLVWWFTNTMLVFIASIAVLLHQLSDGMWHEPVTWFYPVLGPLRPEHYINYFGMYFWIEVSSASEWIFLCAALLVLLLGYTGCSAQTIPQLDSRKVLPVYSITLILLFFLGMYSIWSGMVGADNSLAPFNTPEKNLIIGAVALSGFCIIVASQHREVLTGVLSN